MHKKFLLIILLLLSTLLVSFADELLIADIPLESDNVVSVGVTIDGVTTIDPLILTPDGSAVIIYNITGLGSAEISVWYINDQGRQSDAVPFLLKRHPPIPNGMKILNQ